MKLLPLYASDTGLDIRHQWLLETFYPLVATRYITLHASSGMAAKNYPLYNEVIRLIAPMLSCAGIQIVQLGGPEDPPLSGCVHLQGKTTKHQASYILRRSMLHLGNDSWLAHRAGELRIPLVTLFGPTTAANHGAYTYDPEKTSFIESHRWGRRATFAAQEPGLSIALIPPEQIAREVLRHLHIDHTFTHQSRYWGAVYQHTILELVPERAVAATFLPNLPINVRLDYLHNEEVLAAVLATGRRINLFTKRPLAKPDLLAAHRAQILSYNHEIAALDGAGKPLPEEAYPSAEYVGSVKGLINQTTFYTKEVDAKVVADIRFRYLDICLVEQMKDTTQEDYLSTVLQYLNREDTAQNRLDLASEASYNTGNAGGLMFRSGKLIIANGLTFPSLAHVKANLPIKAIGEVARVIDDPLWYRDLAHFAVHYQTPIHDTATS